MPTTQAHRPKDRDIDDRLDDLIPPPAGPIRSLVAGTAIVGAAAATTALALAGYLYPRPTFGGSFSSGSILEVDPDRDAVSATAIMPNYGSRTVRITDISIDGPGAELVDVGVVLEPPIETTGTDSGEATSATTPWLPLADAARPLPVEIPGGRTATIVVWFRPTECTDEPGPWGIIDVKVDFGAGAFPPLSNRVSLTQDPVAVVDPDATPANGGESVMIHDADGSFREASGPLAGACEALR